MTTEIDIINAATIVFSEKGLKFTMNDVAKELHISKKTIYTYYEGKEALLTAMLDEGFSRIQAKKKQIYDSNLSIEDKLRRFMIAMPDQYQVIDFRKLSDLNMKYPEVYRHLIKYLEDDWEPVYELLKEGIREGKIRDINLPVFKMMVTSSFENFLSSHSLKEYGISYQEALDEMMTIIMKGILK